MISASAPPSSYMIMESPQLRPRMMDDAATAALLRLEDVHSNWQYRRYMVSHGRAIAINNNYIARDEFGYRPPSDNTQLQSQPTRAHTIPEMVIDRVVGEYKNSSGGGSGGAYLFTGISDAHRPEGYEDSDLKRQYLWQQKQDVSLVAPLYRGVLP